MGLLSSIFGGGGSSSSASTTNQTDARTVTDNSGGSLVGTGNRVTLTVTDGSATLVPVVQAATKAAADVNVQAFAAVRDSQAGQVATTRALVDLLRAKDQTASGEGVGKMALLAAAAVAAAFVLRKA